MTEVVTCRAKSSSVAWASLAPFSRSGQATSNASYPPRRTPSRLTCSRTHPTEVAAALCLGSASAWPGSTPWPSTPTCWRPLGRKRAVTALIGLRAGAEQVGVQSGPWTSRNGGSATVPLARALSDKNTASVWAPYLCSARPFGRSGPDNRSGICPLQLRSR